MVSITVGARAPESDVADLLRETEAANPGVAIGSYPFFKEGRYGANFVIRSEDGQLARSTGDQLLDRLREAGVEFEFPDPYDSGVCHMAFFKDPDGNGLILHRRYAPYSDGTMP